MRRRLDVLAARLASGLSDGLPTPDEEPLVQAPAGASLRAAFAAASPSDALAAIATIDGWLASGPPPVVRVAPGVVLASAGERRPRVGLLLPGQGVPAPRHLGALAARFPWTAAAHRRAGIPPDGEDLPALMIQPAIVAASLAGIDVLRRLGLRPAFALGHSLGELTALCWAGACDPAVLLDLVRARARAMTQGGRAHGAMVAIEAPPAQLAELLDGSGLSLACRNAPTRHVVAGAEAAAEAFLRSARARGLRAVPLDVTGAFHSPLMRDAAAGFDSALARTPFARLRRRVISSVTGTWLPADADVRRLLRHQIVAPVRFLDAARVAACHADLLVEAGPGTTLGALMAEIDETSVVSLRVGDRSPRGLLELCAVGWACGLAPAAAGRRSTEGVAQPALGDRDDVVVELLAQRFRAGDEQQGRDAAPDPQVHGVDIALERPGLRVGRRGEATRPSPAVERVDPHELRPRRLCLELLAHAPAHVAAQALRRRARVEARHRSPARGGRAKDRHRLLDSVVLSLEALGADDPARGAEGPNAPAAEDRARRTLLLPPGREIVEAHERARQLRPRGGRALRGAVRAGDRLVPRASASRRLLAASPEQPDRNQRTNQQRSATHAAPRR